MGICDHSHHALRVHLSPRKTGRNRVKILRYARSWSPRRPLFFLVQDNLSVRTTLETRRVAGRLSIRCASIPTNASLQNPVEIRLRSKREIAHTGTDHRNWRELDGAIQWGMCELNRMHSGRPHRARRCRWVRH